MGLTTNGDLETVKVRHASVGRKSRACNRDRRGVLCHIGRGKCTVCIQGFDDISHRWSAGAHGRDVDRHRQWPIQQVVVEGELERVRRHILIHIEHSTAATLLSQQIRLAEGVVGAQIDTVIRASAQVDGATTSHSSRLRGANVSQLIQRELDCFLGETAVQFCNFFGCFEVALGFECAVFVDIHRLTSAVGRLLERGVYQFVTHIHIGLPFVVRGFLAGVLRLHVVNRCQVRVTARVIHGQCRTLVVGCGIVAVESF